MQHCQKADIKEQYKAILEDDMAFFVKRVSLSQGELWSH